MTTNPATSAAVTTTASGGSGRISAAAGDLDLPAAGGGALPDRGSFRVPAERGRTSIANSVVEKIAGMAAREVIGVHDFGGSLARSLGAVRERVPGGRPSVTRGVKVEVGERQTAVDLELVVDYGVAITEVAAEVRENVIAAVERMTGLEVVEVNVAVVDVHLPYEDDAQEARVQ
ncbi:Asp23/Gls24 family envelope stress response protein [Streptomyces sp. HPF1205]|uniref:Asp23/Gls24 family envelope stress response protein n=1 Tax=Streptomyces sp. HPF1205 TaxID=2873262 RepID=UPI001CEC0909|nr:Asp23/Gls24 family envelope stress response protein [Streptomyces sp. HPF1205]